MDFYFADFIEGLNYGLSKVAEGPNLFDISGSIFPNINSQAKWQFARTKEHLHLNDGNNVYCFHLPEGEKEHDFPVTKLDNVCLHEFGKDAVSKGTAQIHRADPGSIYFTIQDGHSNPTYTFKHVNGEQWRAMPKVRSTPASAIDKEHFIKGAAEALTKHANALDAVLKGVDGAARVGARGVMALGHNPLASAGLGLAGGAAYDLGKRTLYNSDSENEEETVGDRLRRYILPTAGLGLTGTALNGTFSNYYKEFPLHRP